MKAGEWIVVLSLALSAGCARPKYVTEAAAADHPQEQSQTADCSHRFPRSGLCLSWVWENRPVGRAAGSLIFKIYRENLFDRSPVPVEPSGTVAFKLWMPSMGHGSVPAKVERLDVGTYRAANVVFIMPGDWDLHFQVREGGEDDDLVFALVHP